MLILQQVLNLVKHCKFIFSPKSVPICPICGKPMHIKEYRKRIVRLEDGKKYWIKVPRYTCDSCHKICTMLPDFLCQFKHYPIDIIQSMVEDNNCMEVSNPTDQTVLRWKKWIGGKLDNVRSFFNSFKYLRNMFNDDENKTLITKLKEKTDYWLPFLLSLSKRQNLV